MSLTERQEEVLLLAGDGLSNAEIGVALDISTRTAKYHVDNLRKRYGCEAKRQLIIVARNLPRDRQWEIRQRIEGRNGQ